MMDDEECGASPVAAVTRPLIPASLMREVFDLQVHRRDQSREFSQAVTCAPRHVTDAPQRGRPVADHYTSG
jgi:hypothetical protein